MKTRDELRREALELLPGVLAARVRGCQHDVVTLLDGFRKDSRTSGFSDAMVWQELFIAALLCMDTLAETVASTQEMTKHEVAQGLAALVFSD